MGVFRSCKTNGTERMYFFWWNGHSITWNRITIKKHYDVFVCFIRSGHIIHPADPSPWESNQIWFIHTLRWRHNGRDGVSNHQPHHCLLNRLCRRRSKKTPKLRVTGLCVGNSSVTGEFPAQRASNAENVSIWWRHHGIDFLAPE